MSTDTHEKTLVERFCRRKLKAAASVERGIGPVCIKYFA